tara:strand:+ start:208 stop:444 length:237 start_codon:yes stop_codon:yes gene_type:complete
LNKYNKAKIWNIIQEPGDSLFSQLFTHPNHPQGRNPYTHLAICIKNKFNSSYKNIPDEKFNEDLKYIKFLKKIFTNFY